MSTKILYIKKNDLQPYYYVKAKHSDGTVIDLTDATIYCTMKEVNGSIKIDRQTTGINITDEDSGEFEYRWQNGDTDTLALYNIEFEINPSLGGKFTLPVSPSDIARVKIVASLDTT